MYGMFSLETLADIVEAATAPEKPSFYRDIYNKNADQTNSIRTWEQWYALPCIGRDDLQAKSVEERSFAPLQMIDAFYISSGTTGRPPLFTARGMREGYEYRKEWYDMEGAFFSGVGPAHRTRYMFTQNGKPATVIQLDPSELRTSCKLAAQANVTGMFLPVFLAARVAELFDELGAGASVRYIELTSEKIPRSLVPALQEIFPNASVYASWGMSELDASPMGIPCRPLGANDEVLYHLQDTCHMDIVDPETLASLPFSVSCEGEALITSYPPSAIFPMIRYRTGDIARIVELSRDKHHRPTFSIVGRAANDFLKIPGGMLRADEIERVLRAVPGISSERFELHRYEKETASGSRYRFVLHADVPVQSDLSALARAIAAQVRVGPSLTLAQAAAEGRCELLECVRIDPALPRKKTLRLIAH
jgi:phenylacetate-coenzyme A ligase PaaK-like adenylate-forming protein